ncbi:hypothetical protein Tco_0069103 [Tanacetum coccineum]
MEFMPPEDKDLEEDPEEDPVDYPADRGDDDDDDDDDESSDDYEDDDDDCDNHDLSRLYNQSIERDRLIGIGFVLNFVKFISFTFGDKGTNFGD